jgi:hypothetical protein
MSGCSLQAIKLEDFGGYILNTPPILFTEVRRMDNTPLLIGCFWFGLAAFTGGYIGSKKGRFSFGLILSLLLGWIGVIILLFVPSAVHHECPFCRKVIHKEATVCPFCQREQTPL